MSIVGRVGICLLFLLLLFVVICSIIELFWRASRSDTGKLEENPSKVLDTKEPKMVDSGKLEKSKRQVDLN
jgi:hypothetical protein